MSDTTSVVTISTANDRYPTYGLHRWVLRLLIALPFIALVLLTSQHSFQGYSSNRILIHHVQQIKFNDPTLSWIVQLFPLVPAVLASIFPNTIILGVFASFTAGWFIQSLLEQFHQKRIPKALQVFLILTIIGSPILEFNVTQNFGTFFAVTLFALGLINMVRFIEKGSTFYGFRAGGLLAAATLSDSHFLLFVLMALVVMPLLRWHRRGQKGAGLSTTLVIAFPAISTFLCLLGIDWLVANQTPVTLFESVFTVQPDITQNYDTDWNLQTVLAFASPVLFTWWIARASRRFGAVLASSIILILCFGVTYYSVGGSVFTGGTYLILTTLGLALLPQVRNKRMNITIAIAAGVQTCIAWWTMFASDAVLRPYFFFLKHLIGL